MYVTLKFYTKYEINKLAKLKNIKNPSTSVAVVKKIDDDKAGSTFNFCNTNGTNNPKIPETIKFPTIANNIIIPK